MSKRNTLLVAATALAAAAAAWAAWRLTGELPSSSVPPGDPKRRSKQS